MKLKNTLLIGGAIGAITGLVAYLFQKPRQILDTLKIRVDDVGNGNFGASRNNGSRDHFGIDLVTTAGQRVYAPVSGTVAIIDNFSKKSSLLKGIKIFSENGLVVDILYINPAVKQNETIKAGDFVGYAQDVRNAYKDQRMTNHIHVEHYDSKRKVFINPTNFYFPNTIARTASVSEFIENPSQHE